MSVQKIAIPSEGDGGLESTRSGHFGHCDVFTIVELAEGKIAGVEAVPNAEHSQGGCMVPVNLLAGLGVDVLICGGMGLRPLQGFQGAGIDVYFDRTHSRVEPLIQDFIAGKLQKMSPAMVCGGH